VPLVKQDLVTLSEQLCPPQDLVTLSEQLCPPTVLVRFLLLNHEEEFEYTKGAIRNRILKKNRQHNGQKKKYKRTNNDQQNIHIKLKIE